MNKKQKRGHNKNIQLIKELDRRNTYPPLKYSPTLRSRGMGDFYVKLLSIVEKEPEICYSIKGK